MSAIIDHAVACDKGETALIERAPQEHTPTLVPRRVVMSAVIAATTGLVSAAVPVTTEAAEPDPIFALIAELRRLEALSDAADDRAKACRPPDDEYWTGGRWIPFDTNHPALKPMHGWLVAQNADRQGTFFHEVLRVERDDIERFNAHTEQFGGPERKAQGAARLAWFDGRIAERNRKRDISGYTGASDEADSFVELLCEAESAICDAIPTTIAGAMAQIGFSIEIKLRDDTIDGELPLKHEDGALMNAYEALRRLLPLSAGGDA